jgi:CheY-like chemotaxis protein
VADANSSVALSSEVAPDEYQSLGLGQEFFRGTETILLVEDEGFVREVTKEVLQSAGYRVLMASNATEALAHGECLRQVDLLLTDIVLPGKDGRALAGVLRSLQPNLAVLFVSGYPLRLAEIAAAEPAEAWLPKPFSVAALLQKVRQVLSGKTERRTDLSARLACGTGSPS